MDEDEGGNDREICVIVQQNATTLLREEIFAGI